MVGALLAGKVALVAGVGSGIGGATARLLASAGADIGAIDVADDPAEEVMHDVRTAGRNGVLVKADLREPEQVTEAVKSIEQTLGPLDVLVTVAGGMTTYQPWRRFDRTSPADWDEMIDRNLTYVTTLCRAILPQMVDRQSGGSIVFTSSISGYLSAPNHAAYGAAKGGLISLTKSLAMEYGSHGIRVNSVAPGSIATAAVASHNTRFGAEALWGRVALGRAGDPTEVAGAILFLASPLASYVTGQTVLVDGGISVQFPFPFAETE
jgi:3-oxoacyl-[acyl-carrier protein] reductase